MADGGEGGAFPIGLPQNVVMRLMLKLMRQQSGSEMFSQKLHPLSLISSKPQAHPHKMKVIRHEAIDRAEKPFLGGGVQHDLAKTGMERLVEPAGGAVGDGESPVNHRVATIVFGRKAGEIEGSIGSLVVMVWRIAT